jgi:isopentenyl diphosphate isomerase/L-lactate dehydrogenase-like FMN-dependent dehydrogenase
MSAGRQRQAEVFLAGVRGRRPRVPADPAALEERARGALPPQAFAYLAGGAGTESTLNANRAAFERHRIVPRMLHGVSARDLGVELFGRRLPAPLLLAPIGVLELARSRGDLHTARAAAGEGVPCVFSSQASVPMEECAGAMGDAPRWFQLYRGMSDELSASFVRRAEACGCEAIVLTLDTTQLGWRTRDLDLAYLPFLYGKGLAQYTSDPVFQQQLDNAAPPAAGRPTAAALRALVQIARAYPGATWRNVLSARPRAAIALFLETFSNPALSWEDVAFVRGLTDLPLVLKGVLHPDDARLALDRGVDGIIVSNHGGRQVDGAIAALDALPPVLAAVDGRVPVLFDSGIRSGADLFKALALGARAVLLGRPYAYALAVAGEEGVRETIRNLVAEFDLTLGLAGCASVADLGPERLSEMP